MISSATASSETDTTSSGTVTQNSVFNANGELTSVTNTSTGDVQNYSYDADGNTTEVQDGDGTVLQTYTWDPQGRMIAATSGGNTVSYTYNDSDDRTSETVNDQTTTFLNDPNQAYDQVLEEYAENGVLAATYIRGIDLLFEDQSGVLSYYVSDNLGSTRALTNSAGAITETYSYDAYGNLIANTGTTVNPYLFTGQWFDAAIGQYYLRARDYNPSTGAFTSRDSFGGKADSPLTENHYLYAGADPVDWSDPGGRDFTLTEMMSVGATIGGVAGLVIGGAIGAYRAGTVFSLDTLRYAVAGLVGGAAAGALLGAGVYFATAGVGAQQALVRIMWGERHLISKILQVPGHTQTLNTLVISYVVGFGWGVLDPDTGFTIAMGAATVLANLNDALVRGLTWDRDLLIKLFGGNKELAYAYRTFLLESVQSTTMLTLAGMYGFTFGYWTGSNVRRIYDELSS